MLRDHLTQKIHSESLNRKSESISQARPYLTMQMNLMQSITHKMPKDMKKRELILRLELIGYSTMHMIT